ncbi:MAG: DEAD/DEAH box helicase [Bacillota bacterium]
MEASGTSHGGNSLDRLAQLFHPVVWSWFMQAFGQPSPPQALAWPAIARGDHVLLLAPTGSGKTLAAFLQVLDTLYKEALGGQAHAGVQVLYISPLKALNNDMERNLEVPLAGIAAAARQAGLDAWPRIQTAVRTGDTPQRDRQRQVRRPPQVLITTPESLYLMLTSARAREPLRSVRFVIVDEIHALAGNKRGVHLSLSLERLEHLTGRPFQRTGLSATQRPLEEVARYLGGLDDQGRPRPVTVLDAGLRKGLDLRVISPVPDLRLPPGDSVWPSIYQRLLELVESHRSTLVFCNNRRQAERLASSLNALAGRELARTHHGSLSREQREQVEQQLKEGRLRCLVATSSLELGIDVGAVDLVAQVESPKGVARGLQRVGRAGHLLRAASKGRIIPKTRADLLEAAAAARGMAGGAVEPTRVPRHCLDVLAQQIVAMAAVDSWPQEDLLRLVRRAYPYQGLERRQLENVLEMLAGRYSAAEFCEFRPRLHWDRTAGLVRGSAGSRLLSLRSGGTIPNKGLFTVYLADGRTRLGELDEEQVWETRVGDVFMLGTASWRVEAIEHDRVLVSAAPGAVPRVPFWRGDGLGRPASLGEQQGALLAEAAERLDDPALVEWLQSACHLDDAAAKNLAGYLRDQREAAGVIPSDRVLLAEAFPDELGDWRLVLHSPYGAAVHAAWSMAIKAWARRQWGFEPDAVYGDDGILLRAPGREGPPPFELVHGVTAGNVQELILEEMGSTSLFGSYFRYNAGRALVLPREGFGRRTPLWLQRLRSKDLLAVARRHPDHPLVMETYREIMQDVLEVPALQRLLERLERGEMHLETREGQAPSPFAASLLFAFQGSFMYEYDRPKAEQQSALLSLDRDLLRELLGGRAWSELLDQEALQAVVERVSGRRQDRLARTDDEVFELLARQGDLSLHEVSERSLPGLAEAALPRLEALRRAGRLRLGGQERWVAAEDIPLYEGALRDGAADRLRDILRRYATYHGPFSAEEAAARYGWDPGAVTPALESLEVEGFLTRGLFTTDAAAEQWCEAGLVQQAKQSTLARLRSEVEACEPEVWQRFALEWHGLAAIPPVSGPNRLKAALQRLQGLFLPAEAWEREVLSPRLPGYQPSWLDQLLAAGEAGWVGRGSGPGPGKVAFFLADGAPALAPTADPPLADEPPAAQAVRRVLQQRGALFLGGLAAAAGLTAEQALEAVWFLVWRGEVTNDTFAPVRALLGRQRLAATGRWSLVQGGGAPPERTAVAWAEQLLARHGLVTREVAEADSAAVPWPTILTVLKEMEMAGRVRRGYFVHGLSGLQFALPEAVERLRRVRSEEGTVTLTFACDPATLWGTVLPERDGAPRLSRIPGQFLVCRGGRPLLVGEGMGRRLVPVRPLAEADLNLAVSALPSLLPGPHSRRRRLEVAWWGDAPAPQSEAAAALAAAGFERGPRSFSLWPKA